MFALKLAKRCICPARKISDRVDCLQALCHEEKFTALVRMALQRPSIQSLSLLYRLASQGPPEVQIMLEPHVEDFVALAKVEASHIHALSPDAPS